MEHPPVAKPAWSGAELAVLLQMRVHPGRAFRRVPGLDLEGESVWVAGVEPGYPAADLWTRLRGLYPQTGMWPVIATGATCADVGSLGSMYALPSTTVELDTDSRAWLLDKLTRLPSTGDATEAFPRSEQDWSQAVFDGAREDFRSFGWTDVWEVAGGAYDRMLLVPAARPWLVPGRLGWLGACNYDFGWRDHATILRRWQAVWSTELVALDRDTMWLRHLEPITAKAPAIEAAREVAVYCPDAINDVDFDDATLDRLATVLLGPMWRLWWD
ncbi:DUF4253 domain-containing protein [Nocardia carnea]|uniref:DUF4253 domain-containing protein n=1 Tax=Nocardia carnea TaxID=37328 RepID=UPI0024575C8B|nr:DUF4253 domain-containing protein [Nocardia carnea]